MPVPPTGVNHRRTAPRPSSRRHHSTPRIDGQTCRYAAPATSPPGSRPTTWPRYRSSPAARAFQPLRQQQTKPRPPFHTQSPCSRTAHDAPGPSERPRAVHRRPPRSRWRPPEGSPRESHRSCCCGLPTTAGDQRPAHTVPQVIRRVAAPAHWIYPTDHRAPPPRPRPGGCVRGWLRGWWSAPRSAPVTPGRAPRRPWPARHCRRRGIPPWSCPGSPRRRTAWSCRAT